MPINAQMQANRNANKPATSNQVFVRFWMPRTIFVPNALLLRLTKFGCAHRL